VAAACHFVRREQFATFAAKPVGFGLCIARNRSNRSRTCEFAMSTGTRELLATTGQLFDTSDALFLELKRTVKAAEVRCHPIDHAVSVRTSLEHQGCQSRQLLLHCRLQHSIHASSASALATTTTLESFSSAPPPAAVPTASADLARATSACEQSVVRAPVRCCPANLANTQAHHRVRCAAGPTALHPFRH
jgi:hypothetical protein